MNTYLFIDARYLRRNYRESFASRWFRDGGDIDFNHLIKEMCPAQKSFYYDCLDDRIVDPEEKAVAFFERIESQKKLEFNKIASIKGSQVRLGHLSTSERLETRTKKKNEGNEPTQKGVDVLLAVEMMNHAINKSMGIAKLLSGDADFIPLIESVVRLGVFVEIIADPRTVSSKLIWVADDYRPLRFQDYFKMSTQVLQTKRPIPGENEGRPTNFGHLKVEKGSVGKETFEMGLINEEYVASFNERVRSVHGKKREDLVDYLELVYGPISWI